MLEDISLLDGAIWYIVLLFSTTLHEASHAFAALKLGDDTAHRGGQVSLDPIPHVKREPFGMVIVPLLSYVMSKGAWMMGWASAPYDPQWAARYPKRAGIMAMAGPASNLLMVIIAAIVIRLGMVAGVFDAPDRLAFDQVTTAVSQGNVAQMFAALVSVMFSLNLLLFLFNLLPFPPLDGSAIPLFFLSHENALKYSEFIRSPALAMMGLFISWKLFAAIYPPVHLLAIHLLYPGLRYS